MSSNSNLIRLFCSGFSLNICEFFLILFIETPYVLVINAILKFPMQYLLIKRSKLFSTSLLLFSLVITSSVLLQCSFFLLGIRRISETKN